MNFHIGTWSNFLLNVWERWKNLIIMGTTCFVEWFLNNYAKCIVFKMWRCLYCIKGNSTRWSVCFFMHSLWVCQPVKFHLVWVAQAQEFDTKYILCRLQCRNHDWRNLYNLSVLNVYKELKKPQAVGSQSWVGTSQLKPQQMKEFLMPIFFLYIRFV